MWWEWLLFLVYALSMCPLAFFSSCSCFCGCGISSDTFSSSLDGKWSVVSGTWGISSGTLRCTSPGVIYDSTGHPDGSGGNFQVAVTLQFKAASGDNTLRVLLAYADSSNYLYAEFNRVASGCNSLQLGKVESGVDTPLGAAVPLSTVSLNTNYIVNVCYSGEEQRLRAYFPATDGTPGSDVAATGTGDKVGFAVTAGDCSFDNYAFNHAKGLDSRTDCTECTSSCQYGGHSLTGSVDTCLWEVVSGTWTTNYECTSTPGLLRYKRPHPTGKTHMAVFASTVGILGEEVRVIANYLDDDNYHYAHVKFEASTVTLSVYKRSGGGDTLLAERVDTPSSGGSFSYPIASVSIALYFNGTHCVATYGGIAAGAASSEIAGGIYAGIGADAGTPRFAAFSVFKHQSVATPAEPACTAPSTLCGCVLHLLPPRGLVVDLGAGGWTNGTCDLCDETAGEYILGDVIDGACGASVAEVTTCTSPCNGGFIRRSVAAVIVESGLLKWVVTVQMIHINSNPSCPTSSDDLARAIYESEEFASDQCHVMPRTLTKVSEDFRAGLCAGALPETITLDEA